MGVRHPRSDRYWENKSGLLGLAIMAVVVFAAIGADVIMPHFYGDQDLMERLKPPVWIPAAHGITY